MIFYTPTPDYGAYLMHHGIKGQKWGVKNGPPYPLKGNNGKSTAKPSSGSVKKEKTDSKVMSYKSIKDIQNDKSIDFVDWSYGGQASKKAQQRDFDTIKSLKSKEQDIKKIIKDYKNSKQDTQDLVNLHKNMNNAISDIIGTDDWVDFDYLGYGSNGAQFGFFDVSNDVYCDIFIDDSGKIKVEFDYYD